MKEGKKTVDQINNKYNFVFALFMCSYTILKDNIASKTPSFEFT